MVNRIKKAECTKSIYAEDPSMNVNFIINNSDIIFMMIQYYQ